MRKIWLALRGFRVARAGITAARLAGRQAPPTARAGEAGRSRARQGRRAGHDLRIRLADLPALRRFRRTTRCRSSRRNGSTPARRSSSSATYPLDQLGAEGRRWWRAAPRPSASSAFVDVLFKQQARLGRCSTTRRDALHADRRARRHERGPIRHCINDQASVERRSSPRHDEAQKNTASIRRRPSSSTARRSSAPCRMTISTRS